MKKLSFLLLSLSALVMLQFQGCIGDKCTQEMTWVEFTPVYMSYEEMRAAVETQGPRDLKVPGKIYYYNQHILINELGEGVHVINNSNPSNPVNVGFIRIPGNYDMAVKGDRLYADSYIDLVTIDISDLSNAREISRIEEVYPWGMQHQGLWGDPNLGVVVRWNQTERKEMFDCNNTNVGWGRPNVFMQGTREFDAALISANGPVKSSSASGGGEVQTGVGGSMARMTLAGDYLYAVTPTSLFSYSIADLSNPVKASEVQVGWNIETVFPFNDHLLIGSATGMFTYSLQNPASPTFVSEFSHVNSCDPVVAEGDYAYVTLRSGNACAGFTNQLEVLNISNMATPYLVATYPMYNPHGLGISNGTLFICDGTEGLKVYDASDPLKISDRRIAHFPGIQAFDVIPLNSILLMIGEDGFYQYDYSDLNNIRLLSSIQVVE